MALYFRDTERFSVLTPVAEAESAHRIQRLEVEEWATVFSCPPALPLVLRHVRRLLPRRALPQTRSLLRFVALHHRCRGRLPRGLRVALHASATEIGWKLHDLDCERRLLNATMAFVGSLPSQTDVPGRLRRHLRSKSFCRYLDAVERVRLASASEKERFLFANLRLVVVVAKYFDTPGMALIDLIQEGNIGLMRAVDRYDVRKGFRFSTYAVWWIRHAIGRAIAQTGRMIRLPVYATEQRRKVRHSLASFEAEHGREPTDEEIFTEIGLDAGAAATAKSRPTDLLVSLDQPFGSVAGGRPIVDQLVDEDAPDAFEEACRREWRSEVRSLVELLPAVERVVIRRHYGLDDGEEQTLQRIGQGMGRSRERARQLAQQALERLRKKAVRSK